MILTHYYVTKEWAGSRRIHGIIRGYMWGSPQWLLLTLDIVPSGNMYKQNSSRMHTRFLQQRTLPVACPSPAIVGFYWPSLSASHQDVAIHVDTWYSLCMAASTCTWFNGIWYHRVPHSTSILNIIPNLLVISLEMRIAIAPKVWASKCADLLCSLFPSILWTFYYRLGNHHSQAKKKRKKGPLPNHSNHHCHVPNNFNYLHHVSTLHYHSRVCWWFWHFRPPFGLSKSPKLIP